MIWFTHTPISPSPAIISHHFRATTSNVYLLQLQMFTCYCKWYIRVFPSLIGRNCSLQVITLNNFIKSHYFRNFSKIRGPLQTVTYNKNNCFNLLILSTLFNLFISTILGLCNNAKISRFHNFQALKQC